MNGMSKSKIGAGGGVEAEDEAEGVVLKGIEEYMRTGIYAGEREGRLGRENEIRRR